MLQMGGKLKKQNKKKAGSFLVLGYHVVLEQLYCVGIDSTEGMVEIWPL